MKKNNKAFTIVELVIVIAVIAILAAVLIPTFSNIIKKAQKSSDTQLIRNLNNALAIDLAEKEEDKHATCYDAMKAVDEAGYNVARIVAKSGYNIAWDIETGHFVLLDEQNDHVLYPVNESTNLEYNITDEAKKANYFVVRYNVNSDDYIAPEHYSLYAGNTFNAKNITLNGVGFDAGQQKSIETVKYVNNSSTAKDVVIRTNSFDTKIIINAPLDTARHYGYAAIVNVEKIANASYHENGTVGRLEVEAGHAVLESGSTVVCPMDADGTATGATITVNEGAKVHTEGDYEKADNGVANEHVDDCGAGHHTFGKKIVVDSEHIYEVCKCCGYTLITIQDNNGHEVKQTKNIIDATTKKVTSEVPTPIETYLVNVIVNETPTSEIIANYEVNGDPIVSAQEIVKKLEQSTCDHDFGEGVVTTAPTCTSTGIKTYTCSKCSEKFAITLAMIAHDYHDYLGGVHSTDEKCLVCGHNRTREVAKIGTTVYNTLTDAIKAVPKDGVNTKITLINDDAIEVYIPNGYYEYVGWNIEANQNITIDLNGYKLKNLISCEAYSSVIYVNPAAQLTIMDSSCTNSTYDGTGKIYNEMKEGYVPGGWPNYNYHTNVITNLGTLVLQSGIVDCKVTKNNDESAEGGYLGYCVDVGANISGFTNALFTMNGGYLKGTKADQSIRLSPNQNENKCTFIMNNGLIDNGIWIQQPNENNGPCEVVINNGTVTGMIDLNNHGSQTFTMNGGTITASKLKIRENTDNKQFVIINGGTFTYSKYEAKYGTNDLEEIQNDIKITGSGSISYVGN